MANKSLHQAKRAKQDEFYTRMEDISKEMYHYRRHFKDKVVFLNCDDPEWSNFWRYFELNFDDLGLRRLISTHYHPTERTYKLVMEHDESGDLVKTKTDLEGNGDFRSQECLDLLDECDIVCTNPPFSIFREYIATLMNSNKKFLVLGNQNAITYKEIFPLLKEGEIWLGVNNGAMEFEVPSDYTKIQRTDNSDPNRPRYFTKLGNICWFTNLDTDKRHEPITLWKDYDPKQYPHYDNYDAIEVSKVNEIPVDYYGVMGVPITFMDKYCPEQFRIVKFRKGDDDKDLSVNGKTPYFRILVQRVDQPDES